MSVAKDETLTHDDVNAVPDSVLSWYSRLYSRRVDIVGDYAGNELFLIQGESLLLNCLSDAKIDFETGFQLLHATWAVESFLRGLIARRCNFQIAFFEPLSELCVPPGTPDHIKDRYLLARAAIIRHLRANLPSVHPDVHIHVFGSTAEFKKYLRSTDLYFVMIHDGATSDVSRKHVSREDNNQAKRMFRLLIWWLHAQGYSVALINGLEWKDTKVVTAVVENLGDAKAPPAVPKEFTSIDSEAPTSAISILEGTKSSANTSLTERELLAALAMSKLAQQNKALANAFLRHVALLFQLPLSERSLDTDSLPDEANAFLQEFSKIACQILNSASWKENISGFSTDCNVGDLVDGRLFAVCIQDSHLGQNERYEHLVKVVKSLSGLDASTESSNGSLSHANGSATAEKAKSIDSGTKSKGYAVLPFSNEVFEKHLGPVHLTIDQKGGSNSSAAASIFREISHWHNSSVPVDPKLRETRLLQNKKKEFFARRRNQWFMAEMMAYAASLTNAVGKSLEPEIITAGGKTKSLPPPTSEKKAEKGKQAATSKGGKKGNKKELMMAEIAAAKSQKEELNSDKILLGWRTTCKTLDQEPNPVSKFQKTTQYILTLNTDLKRDVLEAEIRLFLLKIVMDIWVDCCRQQRKESNAHIAALLFSSITSFWKFTRPITKTIAKCLTSCQKLLGLPRLEPLNTSGDRPLAFTFDFGTNSALDLSIPDTPKNFQLKHCGPYFERSIDSAPDSRVPFEPDAWQRKVLDEIDARNSLLVIAPTSAGKTFISFYAMQQVLEANDDSVLVYVAPTKALVNQIAAEVQARFSKTYKYPGNSVWGIHTRDYRINNPTGCQVLVTVPHILQIMLLAPSNAKSWSERVKYIIFDEVHCIGQAEDGLIWEQLLLLAPCPIIALSATIGNPTEFNDWLVSTQRAVGNKLTMVQHKHRYSDLRKFVYQPSKGFVFKGLSDDRSFAKLGLDDDAHGFSFIHPVAALDNSDRGMPDDFAMEPRDCLLLWESMNKHQTPEYPLDKSLGPSVALPEVIRKLDTIKWEASLKQILRTWMADKNSPFKSVFQDLNGKLPLEIKQPNRIIESSSDDSSDDSDDSEASYGKGTAREIAHNNSTLQLLSDLHEQDALPGIIFNYDRNQCEELCRTLQEQLSSAESAWKESSPKWKSKLEAWDQWKKAMAKADKRRPPKISSKKGAGGEGEVLTKADLMRDNASSEASPWASFNPEDPVEGFHFADNKKASQEEIKKHFKELVRREVPEWLLNGLRRGIGVHHAGLNRKARQVVEILFRKGFLRVVIATGTLALGINMPCKTVVFSGDSIFLTALNYRQAAGRAGRRGFDMLGNVVFHGVSMSKVRKLMSSRLPDLNGHFPITTTLILRLFTLLDGSKNSPFAIRSVDALLSQPRLYLGGEESKMTVLHHLRFSIEYLRRQHLLDAQGRPLNFAGCVSHLYFTENSAFAFHALLKEGYFHELCSKIDTQSDATIKELMLTMSHLFGRQYFRHADTENLEELVKNSPSMVILPSMPKRAAEVLRGHNKQTLDIFTAYVKTFVEQHLEDADNELPLTQLKIGGNSSSVLPNKRAPTTVRSPFVALSGHGDEFDSINDLCMTSRSGVFLEEAVVPSVGLYPEESDLPLNAYLYDFFNHADVTALAKANHIRAGDVWFVLNDFSMVLATIITSLSNFMKLTSDSDLDFTDIKGEGEEAEEAREDNYLPPDASAPEAGGSGTATPATRTAAATAPTLPIIKKKKKVLDSWDAESSDDEPEDNSDDVNETWDGEGDAPAWEEDLGLLNVLKAFKLLREDFDTKFRSMWA